MKILEKQFNEYLDIIKKDKVTKERLVNVGIITRQQAKRYCLVGPTSRASGFNNDIREKHPYDAYPYLDFDVMVSKQGDAYARLTVRLTEVFESIKIIRQLMKNLPKGEIPKSKLVFIKEGIATSQVEAPRGENFYFTIIKENKVERVKIRTPTFALINILPTLLENRPIGDVPVILHSLDPCFSCMERVIIVKDKKREVLDEHTFLHKYCDHHH